MAQFYRATSINTAGSWLAVGGSTVTAVNEVTPNDATYAYSSGSNAQANWLCNPAGIVPPSTTANHIFRIRIYSVGSASPERVRIFLATSSGSPTVVYEDGYALQRDTPEQLEFAIDPADVPTIFGDYSTGMRVGVTITSIGGGDQVRVTWFEVEIPDGDPTTPVTGSAAGTSTAAATAEVIQNVTVTGSAVGTSAASANVVAIYNVTGSATGTSTAAALAVEINEVSGTAAGTSFAIAVPTVTTVVAVTGSATGTSFAIAVPSVYNVITGTAAGASTAIGNVEFATIISVSGSAAGTSTASGNVTVTEPDAVTGLAAGVSTASATVVIAYNVTGLAAGVSTAVAASVTQTVVNVTGAADGISSASAIAVVAESTIVVGSATGTSTATGVVAPLYVVTGVANGTSTAEAFLLPRFNPADLPSGYDAGSSYGEGIELFGKFYDIPDEFQIEFALDQTTKSVTIGASTEIELVGAPACAIRDQFFAGCAGLNEILALTFYVDCDKRFEFASTYEAVTYCPDLERATIRLQDIENRKCFDYLNDTVFWTNGWLDDANAGVFDVPKMRYCKQPSQLFWIIRQIFAALAFILTLLDDLDRAISGCNRYRTTPLIRQVIEYHCGKCELNFSSTILQGDYANLVLFEPLVDKGFLWRKRSTNDAYDINNSTNFTIIELLESLKPVFNADYQIIDGTLHFERVDFFDEIRNVQLFDVTVGQHCIEDLPCYEIDPETKCDKLRLEYTRDQIDTEGNKSFVGMYKDIVEWNEPPNEWQRGECSQIIQYSPPRFVLDRVTGTVDDDNSDINEGFEYIIDRFRAGYFAGVIPNLGGAVKNAVIVDQHIGTAAKLILLENNYNADDAVAIRREISTPIGDRDGIQMYDYNYPMFADEFYAVPELYQRFHAISDPRKYERSVYVLAELTFAPDDYCDALDMITNNFNRLYINTHFGKGIPVGSIVFNEKNRTVTVQNIRIKC